LKSLTKYTLKPSRIFILILLIFTYSQHNLLSQNNENRKVIEDIYNLIENNKSTQKIFELTPKVKWETTKTGDRNTITLYAIVKNQWRGVDFDNLQFKEMEKNKIRVTGSVMGKQPTECEPVSTDFQHIWTVKDGQILHLNE
jgi:hypothetical protein